MADLLEILTNDAGLTAEQYGVGPAWVGGIEYWSTGHAYQPSRKSGGNTRSRADRANSDQYINFAEHNPSLVSGANGSINPSISVEDDLSGVVCSMDGTSTNTGFCGLKVIPDTPWDLSAQHTYPGQSADTVFLLDMEFPEMPNGNTMQHSTAIAIYFVTNAGFSDFFYQKDMLNKVDKTPRQMLAFRASEFISTGAPVLSQVNKIEIRVTNEMQTNEPISVKIRGLYVNVKRKGRVVLSFDNAHTSWFSKFYTTYIRAKGWGCSQAFVMDRVGNTGVMTLAMLQDAQASGCEMVNHTTDHQPAYNMATPTISGTGPWTINYHQTGHGRTTGDVVTFLGQSRALCNGTKTITVIDADNYTATETVNDDSATATFGNIQAENPLWTDQTMIGCSEYFEANGLVESPVFVYPGGFSNPDTWAQLERLGFVGARGVRGGGEPANASNYHYGLGEGIWSIPSLEMSSADTAASLLAEMDHILSLGADCHVYGHSFADVPVVITEFPAGELPAFVEGIQARIDSGLCDTPINLGEAICDH